MVSADKDLREIDRRTGGLQSNFPQSRHAHLGKAQSRSQASGHVDSEVQDLGSILPDVCKPQNILIGNSVLK